MINPLNKNPSLVRNCKFRFQCSKRWEDLQESPTPTIRNCPDCKELVWLVDDEHSLAQLILNDFCVAISPDLYDRTVVEQHRKTIKAGSGRLLGSYHIAD